MRPSLLQEHPEGGRFEEVFRSGVTVDAEGEGRRAAVTHIYFRLGAEDVSRFHRVTSDEIWNLYEGALRLYTWSGAGSAVETVVLSGETQDYCHVVRAGQWQAAEPVGGAALVGCSVAPGFDFDDFMMLRDRPETASELADANPELAGLL